jgi:protoheme IX farnesyltransferase
LSSDEAVAERGFGAAAGSLVRLTKQRQTLLLLATGAGAYALSVPRAVDAPQLLLGIVALWAPISGCTVLNMVLDRDIDAMMARTAGRPLPAGEVPVRTSVAFGLMLSGSGLALSWALGSTFGAVVTAGFAIDLWVYTGWLKRRTPLAILFGGVSGGMPALAGRVLALGYVDAVGLLLALGILLWIPAHILTLAMGRADEYRAAGVPCWPCVYGTGATRRLIAASTMTGALTLLAAGWLLHVHPAALVTLAVLGTVLSGIALAGLFRPSDRQDRLLFKTASVYMSAAFGCLVVGATLGV